MIENKIVPLLPEEAIDFTMTYLHDRQFNCHEPEPVMLLETVRQLYYKEDLLWIEQAALFYEALGDCLFKEQKDGKDYMDKAIKLYVWMGEGSDYLHTLYPGQIETKREELERCVIDIKLKIKAQNIVNRDEAGIYLRDIAHRLESSHYLMYPQKETRLFGYLLMYDMGGDDILIIATIINQLKSYQLLGQDTEHLVRTALRQKVAFYEQEISAIWFSFSHAEKTKMATQASHLIILTFLLENDDYEKRILAARICRYLSIFDTPYQSLLKEKAYKMLALTDSMDGRFEWDDILHFNLPQLISKIVNIHVGPEYPADTSEGKWIQFTNWDNTITLDKDGFTLSPVSPYDRHSWRGRKDRVSLFDKRLYVASFSKPTQLYETCKNMVDLCLYWRQIIEDYPLYIPLEKSKAPELPEDKSEVTYVYEESYPSIGEEVLMGVECVDERFVRGIILNEAYRGMKAVLPHTQINTCYSHINGFTHLFSVNDSITARVTNTGKEGIKVSLLQAYNEYVYPESMRKKQMPAMITEYENLKIKWLLINGATTTTPYCRKIKPRVGDIYNVNFTGAEGSILKPTITLCLSKPKISSEEFFRQVWDNLQEFASFIRNLHRKNTIQEEVSQFIKDRNNPFVAVLENLNLDPGTDVSQPSDEAAEEDPHHALICNQPVCSLHVKHVEELIYCLDLFVKDLSDQREQFSAYYSLRLLCHIIGKQELASFYEICADYLYNINMLASDLFHEYSSPETILKFDNLQIRMNDLGLSRYGAFRTPERFIRILHALANKDKDNCLRDLLEDDNHEIAELARYFAMLPFLAEKDTELAHIISSKINILLGIRNERKNEKSVSPVAAYFGLEGVEREFKTSAFFHANKQANEEQCVRLARVIASFMNTDGGTLYIGVNDMGYLSGLAFDLKADNDNVDTYIRKVTTMLIKQLGESKEAKNRFQEYIRSGFHEYPDGRQVLAFRVPPINEVVTVNGSVYTRSASSCIIKPEQNEQEFIQLRKTLTLDSSPRKPEFPTFFDTERNEYIFEQREMTNKSEDIPSPIVQEEIHEEIQEEITADKTKATPVSKSKKAPKTNIQVATSKLRNNPLQKKAQLGYTNKHLFVSLFANGKIACSPNPKIGVWGEKDGKVIFSFNPIDEEDLLVCVFKTGQIGIASLKQIVSAQNTPTLFIDSIDDLMFMSPASRSHFLLLISDRDGDKRFRLIRILDFEKSMNIQPKLTQVLIPEKGTWVFVEILTEEQVKALGTIDKVSLDSFDIYNGGMIWEHIAHKDSVSEISKLCDLSF